MFSLADNHLPLSAPQRSASELSGPRYNTYPTTDRFVEAFTEKELGQALGQRKAQALTAISPLAAYVHVPFCESLCYFCACNKIITRQHGHAKTYLGYLSREIDLYTDILGQVQPIAQLFVGGGTPTFLSDQELAGLMSKLKACFSLRVDGEYTIEVDPRTVDADRLRGLARMGFNRLVFGVQDLAPAVLKAVHREQSTEQAAGLVAASRELGFESIQLDLLYGLPLQSPASFARTVGTVLKLQPDRIALHGYTHQPERHKPQRRISVWDLPSPATRHALLSQSFELLTGAGYVHIGMNYFALPGDSLAIARRRGHLHRNIQGYSALPDCDQLGLGVSAVGRLGATYSQNAENLGDYYDRLERGHLPVARGLAMSRDDLLRRAVIMAIMCQGRVDFEAVGHAFLVEFQTYFAQEMAVLASLSEVGLIELDSEGIALTESGWNACRTVAMVFDRYFRDDQKRAMFSRVL
jgi:oxygen-independent coproporphyrinogen III oxidase